MAVWSSFLPSSFSAHKRIRKPSKRLIEWTEEYDQIFSTRKKTKKPLQSNGKVKIIQSKLCCNFIITYCDIIACQASSRYSSYRRYSCSLHLQATQPITSMSETSESDKSSLPTHDHASLNLLPEVQTPPPEEVTATVPTELQIPSPENTPPPDAPVLSIDTLTPPPEAEPSLPEGLVSSSGRAAFKSCLHSETHSFCQSSMMFDY